MSSAIPKLCLTLLAAPSVEEKLLDVLSSVQPLIQLGQRNGAAEIALQNGSTALLEWARSDTAVQECPNNICLTSLSDSVTLVSSLGDLSPSNGSSSISPSSASQAENRRTPSWRERAVDGSAPASSRAATNPFIRSRFREGEWSCSSHQRRNARTPSP